MGKKAASRYTNQPDDAPADGQSFVTWPMVGVIAVVLGIVAAWPVSWIVPRIDMDGVGNRILVEKMTWPASNYSTRETIAERFPFRAYRAEVFPQPPGYIAILKVFADLAGPANEENEMRRTSACQSAAYLLHAVALLAYIAAMTRWCRAQGYGVVASGLAMITVAVCPILVANTVWLRAEGIAAYLAVASLLVLTSDQAPHWSVSIVAGVLGGLALLMHASALWIVPLGIVLYGLNYSQSRADKAGSFTFQPLLLFLAIAVAMSCWHYVRLVAVVGPREVLRMYGSAIDNMPSDDESIPVGIFRIVFRRPAFELIPEWLATAPVVIVLLAIVPRIRSLLAGDDENKRVGDNWIVATMLLIFVDFALRWSWGGSYQLRFCSLWAAMLAPALVACYQRCSLPWRNWAGGLAIATFFFQIAGCVSAATIVAEPSYVTPAPAYMVRPWLFRYVPVSKLKLEEEPG